MMIADKQLVTLQIPKAVTGAGSVGDWIDLQGYDTEHGIKAMLFAGIGTTPGTCGGYIQASDSSTGASPTTVLTFTTKPATGGSEEAHFVTTQRYVNFVGTVQSAKTMMLAAALVLGARYTP